MFEKSYDKQKVIGIFKELLFGDFDGKNIKYRAELINDLSSKGHHSKYQYKGLNLKAFAEIIGYLIKKHVISDSVTLKSLASPIASSAEKQITTNGADDDKWDPGNSITLYMGNAKRESHKRKNAFKTRWKLIDEVLKKCKNQ